MKFIPLTHSGHLFPYEPHHGTLRRWASIGSKSVRLQTVKFGKMRMTTADWVSEFVASTIEATPDKFADTPATTSSHQAAEAALDAMGV